MRSETGLKSITPHKPACIRKSSPRHLGVYRGMTDLISLEPCSGTVLCTKTAFRPCACGRESRLAVFGSQLAHNDNLLDGRIWQAVAELALLLPGVRDPWACFARGARDLTEGIQWRFPDCRLGPLSGSAPEVWYRHTIC